MTAIAEAAYLIGLYGSHERMEIVAALVLFMLGIGGVLVIGLQSVVTLHRDMNTKQGYMLFMTPNSCYKILGAKFLECGLSILLTGLFYFALGYLDISLLLDQNKLLEVAMDLIRQILQSLTVDGKAIVITWQVTAALAFSFVGSWICIIATAYLADVISAAMLNGKRFNGLISFALFLVLTWAVNRIGGLATQGIEDLAAQMAVSGVISLVFSAVMYWATAKLMEDKLSV